MHMLLQHASVAIRADTRLSFLFPSYPLSAVNNGVSKVRACYFILGVAVDAKGAQARFGAI